MTEMSASQSAQEREAKGIFVLREGLGLILASASPRRSQFISKLGLDFEIIRPLAPEAEHKANESPEAYTVQIARAKAEEICNRLPESKRRTNLILAADTTVALGNTLLGKPANPADALKMLRLLSGREHAVVTSVCLLLPPVCQRPYLEKFSVRSLVTFASWPENVLQAYADSAEAADKAGAYAIQGQGSFLVEKIDGSWSNVVGLPMAELTELLLRRNLICSPSG